MCAVKSKMRRVHRAHVRFMLCILTHFTQNDGRRARERKRGAEWVSEKEWEERVRTTAGADEKKNRISIIHRRHTHDTHALDSKSISQRVGRNIKTTHNHCSLDGGTARFFSVSVVAVVVVGCGTQSLDFVFMLHTQSFNHSVDSFFLYFHRIHYTFVVMCDCEQLPLLCVCASAWVGCHTRKCGVDLQTISRACCMGLCLGLVVHHSAIHWYNICHTLAILIRAMYTEWVSSFMCSFRCALWWPLLDHKKNVIKTARPRTSECQITKKLQWIDRKKRQHN